MSFVSLQNLSAYSLLESPTTVVGLVRAAKERGYASIALTDYDKTYGFLQFNDAAIAAGIKPIFGLQLFIQGIVDQSTKYPLLFLAKDQIGYENILKLSQMF